MALVTVLSVVAAAPAAGLHTSPDGVGPTAAAATTVTGCTTISSPGEYVLSGSVSTSAGACITITTSDVTFDGGGNTITQNNASGVGVLVEVVGDTTNVTVRNVATDGGDRGVYVNASTAGTTSRVLLDDVEVRGVTARNTDSQGIYVEGAGSVPSDFSNVSLVGNRVENSSSEAIEIDVESDNSTLQDTAVTDNVVRNADSDGIEIDSDNDGSITENLLVARNDVDGTSSEGINFDFDQPFAQFRNALFVDNTLNDTSDGFGLDGDSNGGFRVIENVTYRTNVVTNTRDDGIDFDVDNPNNSVDDLVFESNTFDNVSSEGILIEADSDEDIVVSNVTVRGNDMNDVGSEAVFFDVDDERNTLRDSLVEDNVLTAVRYGVAVEADSSDPITVSNLTVRGNDVTATLSGFELELNPPGTPGGTVADLTVESNTVRDASRGIFVEFDNPDNVVTNARVLRNDVDNTTTALRVELPATDGQADVLIAGGRLSNSTTGLLLDKGANADVSVTVESVRFADNTNATAITSPVPVGRVTFRNNGFLRSADFGVANRNTTAGTFVDARENWWGAGDGPSSPSDPDAPFDDPVNATSQADGSGDAVTESNTAGVSNVRFDPFLTQAPASNFAVTITGTNSPVGEGDTLNVTAVVENVGNADDTQTVTLTVGSQSGSSQTVSLLPGESTTVELSFVTPNTFVGIYTATVATANASDSTQVRVRGTFTGGFGGNFGDAPCGDEPRGDSQGSSGENC